MKKINLLVILFIFLISCGKEEKKTFDAKKNELIEIKFAKAKIYVPKNYKKITIENYIKVL
jgi:hypothetical protein